MISDTELQQALSNGEWASGTWVRIQKPALLTVDNFLSEVHFPRTKGSLGQSIITASWWRCFWFVLWLPLLLECLTRPANNCVHEHRERLLEK